jgi:hypothetical protein
MATASGRLGTIIDTIEILLNAEAGLPPDLFTESELIVLLNFCTDELAQRDIWKKVDTLSITSGEPSYDLATLFPDFIHSYGFRYVGSSSSYTYKLRPFASWNQYQDCLTYNQTGRPTAYWLENRTLYLYPTPDSTETDAVQSRHSYLPTAFDSVGATSYTPALPAGEDTVYIYYGCWKICEKFSDDNRALEKIPYYQGLYVEARNALPRRQRGPNQIAPAR